MAKGSTSGKTHEVFIYPETPSPTLQLTGHTREKSPSLVLPVSPVENRLDRFPSLLQPEPGGRRQPPGKLGCSAGKRAWVVCESRARAVEVHCFVGSATSGSH